MVRWRGVQRVRRRRNSWFQLTVVVCLWRGSTSWRYSLRSRSTSSRGNHRSISSIVTPFTGSISSNHRSTFNHRQTWNLVQNQVHWIMLKIMVWFYIKQARTKTSALAQLARTPLATVGCQLFKNKNLRSMAKSATIDRIETMHLILL